MRIEWLYEAKLEYRDLLLYHKNTVGTQSAEKFAKMILSSVGTCSNFCVFIYIFLLLRSSCSITLSCGLPSKGSVQFCFTMS